ncbi:hypothetical protein MS2017_2013 [Bathymodiolus thermophilus thioautotrophic gill symbiont]|uniref:histidine kinase n=1 Tax=Bathymodiolus thermophilus thioautotrophic gill symbiont TaxID=2360 RepID=A0A3G3IPD6_9GAMM|nr:ATP-binding protein [Bathymodiolus thermophilus thioautotrophic gill symbiont]AYQ57671.1 hypothetical protein MS2017_2013 [Bathymodiolus thermophilus thioautotrophic gill symbiont]
MKEANQQFNEAAWVEVMNQVEKTYSLLSKNQQELEDKNSSLETTQVFLSNIMSSMTDVLLVCDQDGLVVQCNNAFKTQLNHIEKEILGTHFSQLLNLDATLLLRLKERKNLQDVNLDIKFGDFNKSEKYNVSCCIRRDSRLRMLGYVFIGRPIGELIRAHEKLQLTHTQLKKSQNRLVESEKMASLGRLVSGIVHEINNPVSFVYGNIYELSQSFDILKQQIVNNNKPPEREVQEIFDDLPELMAGTIEGLERITDIITGLRNFSTIYKEEFQKIKLDSVMKTAVLWTQKSQQKPIEIDNNIQKGLFIFANTGKLHQLFVNLMQNAIHALESIDNPVLSIHSIVEKDTVKIDFIDNGIGIEQSKLSRIFDPFFSTKETGEGMGLGLYICYNIVQEFGGSLSAKNNIGQGLTLTLVLPLVGDDNA